MEETIGKVKILEHFKGNSFDVTFREDHLIELQLTEGENPITSLSEAVEKVSEFSYSKPFLLIVHGTLHASTIVRLCSLFNRNNLNFHLIGAVFVLVPGVQSSVAKIYCTVFSESYPLKIMKDKVIAEKWLKKMIL